MSEATRYMYFLFTCFYLLTYRRYARLIIKQFCFLDADCLEVGESQGSSPRSVGKYPVKPPRPEGDSQTIDTYRCRLFNNRYFTGVAVGFKPARQMYIASQKPTKLPTVLYPGAPSILTNRCYKHQHENLTED